MLCPIDEDNIRRTPIIEGDSSFLKRVNTKKMLGLAFFIFVKDVGVGKDGGNGIITSKLLECFGEVDSLGDTMIVKVTFDAIIVASLLRCENQRSF